MITITTLAELEQTVSALSEGDRQVFVRYSKSPVADCRRGVSHNYAVGRDEGGLSCESLACPAWWPVNGRTRRGHLAMQVRSYAYLLGQGLGGTRAWVLTGREVGRGGDNEPLVADAAPIAW